MFGKLTKITSLVILAASLFFIAACEASTPTVTPTEKSPVLPVVNTPTLQNPQLTNTPPGPENPDLTATPAPTLEVYKPGFQVTDCQFEVPQDQSVRCGYMVVPENRSKPNSPYIRLHVAIFSSKNPRPEPDPIVYLAGGPGSNSLEMAVYTFNRAFSTFLQNRDFIMYDQRGVGLSQPALDCPEIVSLSYELLNLSLGEAEIENKYLEAARACQERLAAAGVDLTAYNSKESAADLEELRLALGYPAWNLLGISYGSRLALTAMRDYPQGIRSVILDSPVPLEITLDVDTPANIDRAFEVLFQGCAQDETCSRDFPDLENTFYNLVNKLDQTPQELQILHPLQNVTYPMQMTGTALMDLVFNAMYSSELINQLPRAIYNASQGLFDTLAQMQSVFLVDLDATSHGMYYTVQCNEELYFSKKQDFQAAALKYPKIAPLFAYRDVVYDICNLWGAGGANPIETLPVASNIPALVLTGSYDPVTPPAYGEMIASQLTKDFYYEFPGLSHGVVTASSCPAQVVLQFLADPTKEPDASCISKMSGPAFESAAITLQTEPFTQDLYGYTGIKPVGWEEIAPGTFARFSVSFAQAASPGFDANTLLLSVLRQLRAPESLEPVTTRQTFAFTWTLYETTVQGVALDIAVTDDSAGAYIIILISPPSDRAFYYDKLFLPAIDTYRRK